MPFARIGDLDAYYERAGSGPPLLFISGSGADLRMKPNQTDGPLPKAFDILSYDQRGLGQSSKPDMAYTMADYADDAARLMDHVGWRSAKVIGVSFGGMVAQEFVLRHSKRVERLVLACTSPGGTGGASFVTVKLTGSNIHFIDMRAGGAVTLTTVFSQESKDKKLKAVHTRTDYLQMSLPGFVSEPEVAQYYGDCEITS